MKKILQAIVLLFTIVTFGWTMSVTGGGSGGSSSSSTSGASSTTTIQLVSGGDVYYASSAFVSVDGAVWTNDRSTFNITSIVPYMANASTIADTTFALRLSTEQGAVGATQVAHSCFWASSFTVTVSSHFGAAVDVSSQIAPRQQLALWTTLIPSSGTAPGGLYGLLIRGWFSQ